MIIPSLMVSSSTLPVSASYRRTSFSKKGISASRLAVNLWLISWVSVPTNRLANRGLYSLTSFLYTSSPLPRSVFWAMSRALPWSSITSV